MISGSDMVLYVNLGSGNVPVVHIRTCTLKLATDLLETTTRSGSRSKTYEYAKYGYEIDVKGLTYLPSFGNIDIQKALINAVKLPFVFSQSGATGLVYSGTVLVSDNEFDSDYDSVSQWSATLQGTGDLGIQQLPRVYSLQLSRNAYPAYLYNINNVNIGYVSNASDIITKWNADPLHTNYVLSAGSSQFNFLMTIPYGVDELPFITLKGNTGFSYQIPIIFKK